MENPTELLDAAFYENAIQTTNQLVQENVHWWMSKCSEYIAIINDIKGLLSLYNAGELHQTLCDILGNLPDVRSPPAVPQILLHLPAPKTHAKKRKLTQPPDDVYSEMKATYLHQPPCSEHTGIVPYAENADTMDLQELESHIIKCRDIVSEVDNMTLHNSAKFGQWLDIAFWSFQAKKKEGRVLWSTFEMWVKEKCGISNVWATEMRHFYHLTHKYPQLLFCRLSLSFFKKHRKTLIAYFESHADIASCWTHNLACTCMNCGPQ